jgi:hypothetical protein
MKSMPKPGQKANQSPSPAPAGAAGASAPAPAPDPLSGKGVERRRSSREPVVTVGMIRPLNHDDAIPEQVLVTNVSLHGVGLRATRTLGVGARYHIEIGVGPLQLTSRLRVVRCRVRQDGTYDIGGEFC